MELHESKKFALAQAMSLSRPFKAHLSPHALIVRKDSTGKGSTTWTKEQNRFAKGTRWSADKITLKCKWFAVNQGNMQDELQNHIFHSYLGELFTGFGSHEQHSALQLWNARYHINYLVVMLKAN